MICTRRQILCERKIKKSEMCGEDKCIQNFDRET